MAVSNPILQHSHTSPLFITFEGVEGAGKTTQIAMLRDWFVDQGRTATVTREPGGEPTAEAIRDILLSTRYAVDPASELFLFLAARAQVTSNVIRPRLAEGQVVLCDRFIDSSVAYQGHARGHDVSLVRELNAFATGGLVPDLTILLDIDPAGGLARQADRNRMEAESLEFHRRVREGYLAEARGEPQRIRIIDATCDPQTVHLEVVAEVERHLSRPSGDHYEARYHGRA